MSSERLPLLDVQGLAVHFGALRAVDGVDLRLEPGETLALVGESGCGKSTLARAIAGLIPCTAGEIRVAGEPVGRRPRLLRGQRGPRSVQMVFQDPQASLNPRIPIGSQVAEAVRLSTPLRGRALDERVASLLALVGIAAEGRNRFPHAFSGGQRQRVALARALAAEPRLLVCDEVTSALDVSIQAQILNLLAQLRERLGLALLFITHDLAVARHIADRTAVMYLGRVVEERTSDALFDAPAHPYTRALLASVPRIGEAPGPGLAGELPSATAPPPGCPFHPRCSERIPGCETRVPSRLPVWPRSEAPAEAGWVRCHLAEGAEGR